MNPGNSSWGKLKKHYLVVVALDRSPRGLGRAGRGNVGRK